MQLGLNALADLTHSEYKSKFALGYQRFQHRLGAQATPFR